MWSLPIPETNPIREQGEGGNKKKTKTKKLPKANRLREAFFILDSLGAFPETNFGDEQP